MDTASGLKGIQGQPRCDCPTVSPFLLFFSLLSVCLSVTFVFSFLWALPSLPQIAGLQQQGKKTLLHGVDGINSVLEK